ncbi:MAG: type II toxin-antitoxin system VapC family toxin [Terracidiphilus sp.]
MSRIFLDTSFFLYLIEGASPRAARARHLLRAFSARRDEILISVMSLGEILAAPLQHGDHVLVHRYRQIFKGKGIVVLPFAEHAVETFARIRTQETVKLPDAIHLAIAGAAGCDLFLTGDDRLQGVTVPGIHFIASFEKAPV